VAGVGPHLKLCISPLLHELSDEKLWFSPKMLAQYLQDRIKAAPGEHQGIDEIISECCSRFGPNSHKSMPLPVAVLLLRCFALHAQLDSNAQQVVIDTALQQLTVPQRGFGVDRESGVCSDLKNQNSKQVHVHVSFLSHEALCSSAEHSDVDSLK
jgi:hypothetical protein